jgi:hypothetical protein
MIMRSGATIGNTNRKASNRRPAVSPGQSRTGFEREIAVLMETYTGSTSPEFGYYIAFGKLV